MLSKSIGSLFLTKSSGERYYCAIHLRDEKAEADRSQTWPLSHISDVGSLCVWFQSLWSTLITVHFCVLFRKAQPPPHGSSLPVVSMAAAADVSLNLSSSGGGYASSEFQKQAAAGADEQPRVPSCFPWLAALGHTIRGTHTLSVLKHSKVSRREKKFSISRTW